MTNHKHFVFRSENGQRPELLIGNLIAKDNNLKFKMFLIS